MRQTLHGDATGRREEPHLARMDAAQIFGNDGNVFGLQVLAHEFCIARADRVAGEALEHVGATEDLGLDAFAMRAALEHVVDQQLHRVTAVTRGCAITDLAFWQQKMVHAADLEHRIAQAGCNA